MCAYICMNTYSTMHRKANEVFVHICEGFTHACPRKCHKADERWLYLVNKAVDTVYPEWFIFNWYFLIISRIVSVSFVNIIDTSPKLPYFTHFIREAPYKLRKQ